MTSSPLKLLNIGYLLLHCATVYAAALPSCANTNLDAREITQRADAFLQTSNVRILYEKKLPQIAGVIASTVGFLASLGLANSGAAVVFRSAAHKITTDQILISYIKPLAPYATGGVAAVIAYKLFSENNAIDNDKQEIAQLKAKLQEKNKELDQSPQSQEAQQIKQTHEKQEFLEILEQMDALTKRYSNRKQTERPQ